MNPEYIADYLASYLKYDYTLHVVTADQSPDKSRWHGRLYIMNNEGSRMGLYNISQKIVDLLPEDVGYTIHDHLGTLTVECEGIDALKYLVEKISKKTFGNSEAIRLNKL